jgi:hypothetical protein
MFFKRYMKRVLQVTLPALLLAASTPLLASIEYVSIPLPLRAAYRAQYPGNCVLFLRNDMHVRFPNVDLSNWSAKQGIVNVRGAPRNGDIAIIAVPSGPAAPYGHVAMVVDVTPTTMTILEANFSAGRVTERRATGTDLADLQRQFRIFGYYRP